MAKNLPQHVTSSVLYWDYCPGNGTRYELVATSLEPLGEKSQWLVALKNMGGSMLVNAGQYLSEDYLAEKLVPRYGKLTGADLTALSEGIYELLK